MLSDNSNKLSPATKRMLLETPATENCRSSFLISIVGDLNEERQSRLESLVIEIRSVAGNIVGIVAYVVSLPEIAALDFVSYIDASQSLYPEDK